MAKKRAVKRKSESNVKSESDDEDATDYEVLKIVDVRYTKSDKREFLIRWKNYSPKQDSWEPEENLSCDELISKFLEEQEKRSKEPAKQLRKKPAVVKRFASPGHRRSKRTGSNRKNYIEAEDGDED
ncbi:hypothetical protein V9T40_010988 [Parthenolecanium corni]|uniref:Chromo domain-containing protein n=1 Tax=Parthenolecanium corni TaxID=536013 RepID=A0AAN9T4L1_9HEMI